ncbi:MULTISPECIES: monovalent cation/H(+) antiporter subunit G [unclassified Cytobacillus]|mgnify:CR=1 FL=1|uniref:monovalent cation/H(+) antiporter subunit G n=1 Tax=unclassified Cytobacillus TaxID=2675268 RepID=UPI00135A4541|nr:monovalent cation/H(+) antiporter subunit G [Cytobacillus sp. AMY 15.2]KAF0817216.1 Na(+) H(+) antiporter subunit G [Bacillus sp. ZZV12-4809]MCM3094099.1 monovalent cation/H(+) antiporter subunit G [Cytobacillus sp. AMY 15.2]
MTEIANFFIIVFVLLGAFFSLVAAFGVIRLPDVYTRNHAASKSATLGVLCVLLGTLLFFYFKDGYFNSRVVLGIIFIFMTSPIAGHLIGRAAYNSGVKLWDQSVRDDLKNDTNGKESAGKGQ